MIDTEEKTWYNVGLRFLWIMEEKTDKYMDFAAEVRRQFMVKMVIVPIVFKNKQLYFINYIYICFPRDIIQLLHGFIILANVGKHLKLTLQLPL